MKSTTAKNVIYFENSATYIMEWSAPSLLGYRSYLDYWQGELTPDQRAISNKHRIQWQASTRNKIIIGP